MIRLENLGVRAGDGWALRGVTLAVESGAFLALVGPSGSGKSTLLRVLATLSVPAEGSAYIGGVEVARHPGRVRHRVGFLPDYAGLYEALKVEEYLNFYADCHRLPGGIRRERRIDNLLELIDLAAVRTSYVETLSRGMRQRLGLARCLIHDPEVLLLDDPADGLDFGARQELRDLLRELRSLRKTIVVSSQALPDLDGLCTHVAALRGGRCVHFGPAPERLADIYLEAAPTGGDGA